MNEKLAIVIPAYKTDYLDEVFTCIKNQTSQDFSLYVFDDASPYGIKECFDKYFQESQKNKYIRFEENLGGSNLAEHWNRCIKNVRDEEWIWLFSDDDIMDCNCVERFYQALKDHKIHDVARFNLAYIDKNDNVIFHTKPYEQYLSSSRFFSLLYSGRIQARMPEFIFKRKKIEEIGGFVVFDLAWRSDNATVIAVSHPNGIYTISKAGIRWRLSDTNISGKRNTSISLRKRLSTIAFFEWVDDFFLKNSLHYEISYFRLMRAYYYGLRIKNEKNSIRSVWKLAGLLKKSDNFMSRMMFVFWHIYDMIKK